MEKEKLIDSIIELEWPMFRDVNGDTRADCQENYPMFVNMRTSQFSAWNEEALSAYREDLRSAEGEGRNLLRDKYIHMMASTDPEGYLHFLPELPPVSEEKKALVEEIWQIMLPQTIDEVNLSVINSNYALQAGFNPVEDSLAIESAEDTPYPNVIAVKEGNENNEAIQALVKALQSDKVRDYIEETYGGAVVALF